MIRGQFLLALTLTFLLATGYFYTAYSATCALPLSYSVGTLDEQFGLSREAAEAAVADAAAVWEAASEEPVFIAANTTATADVVVNYRFDDRQARTDAEARERERLAAVESQSEEVQAAYQTKIAELEAREEAYEVRAARYERDLARYNATVAEYNAEGGAPPEVYDELEAESNRLQAESAALGEEVDAINAQITALNELGEEGNALISRFNERVNDFNDMFADGREFTQGDYQAGEISIYSFADEAELHVVLVHELGHALGIDHVEDEDAYMHYLLGGQDAAAGLQADDIAAFTATCSSDARLGTVPQPWRTLFTWLGV